MYMSSIGLGLEICMTLMEDNQIVVRWKVGDWKRIEGLWIVMRGKWGCLGVMGFLDFVNMMSLS